MLKAIVAGGAAVLALAAPVALAGGRQTDEEQVRARQRISMMEAVLARAVSNGADNVLRQIRNVMPDQPILTGAPQVRGFRLEDYGVFFDVEVPSMRLPITYSLRVMAREPRVPERTQQQVQQLLATVRQLDSPDRERLELMVRDLERQLVAAAPLSLAPAAPRSVGAAALVAPEPQGGPAAPRVIDDPEDAYTREVKAALIDAMLENSLSLSLGPDEWLTVAARDNAPRDPLLPGDTVDFTTWTFRVKGSDLAAFRGGRMTLDEARQRVEVREY